ncbi:hypothetical protein JD844_026244 [Phrynosoma platyrhinos]|uniref:Protein FAM47E n=1 Tax=Phrynosoma platyrhinos TaxID=52577 RepID=A0ABQ7SEL3_PHRPL|nr:hypothetical protein JD844_026244 [Phrynosoma platyrhinos]
MGPVPIILQYKKMDVSQIMPYKAAELQAKSHVIYSKLSPAQKAKKDYIAQIERCLAQHPLALYPHLEESVPPELFRDVVRLLDPEMHLSRGSSHDRKTSGNLHTTVQYQVPQDTKPETRYTPTVPAWLPKKKNPYTWLSEKEVAEREKAAKIAYIPPLDENGGENNIDEDTIMNLFDTRYESKGKASSPIKIVELYHVPGELRECEGRVASWGSIKKLIKRAPSEPKCEKIKYGAWYLHPKKWKKKKATEKDEIPDCLQFFLNLREKNIPKDQTEEMPLHGTYAFEQFLETKGYRKPAGKAVTKSKRSAKTLSKETTSMSVAEESKERQSAPDIMDLLYEAKIEALKKRLHLPPVSSHMYFLNY